MSIAVVMPSLCALVFLAPPPLPPANPRHGTRIWMCQPNDDDVTPSPAVSPLAALAATEVPATCCETGAEATSTVATAACAAEQTPDERRRSIVLGVAAPVAASAFYAFQRLNPVNPVNLLQRMEARSPTLPEALSTGRPTVLEFYAPWCIDCRNSAPTMMRLEKRYGDRMNFVVCNGDDPQNAELVRLFGVDGIPHVALIDEKRKLKATLVGEIPSSVLESNMAALADGTPPPVANMIGEVEEDDRPRD